MPTYIPLIILFLSMYVLFARKMGVVAPTIFMTIVVAEYEFLELSLMNWIFYGVMVAMISYVIYKVFR